MKRTLKILVAATAVALLGALPCIPPAHAQATSIVPGIAMGVLIDQLSKRINEAIERTEQAGNFIVAKRSATC